MKQFKMWAIILSIIVGIIFYINYMFSIDPLDESFIEAYKVTSSELISSKPPIYRVLVEGEKGYLIFSSAQGYQSEIIIASLIRDDGLLINAKTYSENETPAFYLKLFDEKFFERNFADVPINNGFSIHSNVDAITGATVSSNAVSKAVHESVSYIGKNYVNVAVNNPYNKLQFGVVEFVIIGMLLMAYLSYKFKNKKLRTLTLLYSFILMGMKFLQFISYSTFISVITLNFPNIYDSLKWYLLLLGSLALILMTGKNLYCTYMCPFGAMQELEFRLAKLDFFKVNPKIKKYAMQLPGIIAYIAFLLAMFSKNISASSYEPFSLVFGRVGLGVQWLLLPITLFFSLIVLRYYCKFGCPVGFVWKLILRVRRKMVTMWKN